MTVQLNALRSGPRASASGAGTLLHYSRRAINLDFGSRVVTLLNRDGILTPSSIILDVDALERIEEAFIDGDNLTSSRFSVIIENPVDLKLHIHGGADIAFVERILRSHLRQKERSIMNALLSILGEEIAPPTSWLEAVVLRDQVRSLNENSVIGLASKLLGRGFGLTPSGDDFILGMISIMDLFGKDASALRGLVAQYKNVFARTVLADALDGYYPRPLLSMLNSLASNTDADYSAVSLLGMGHTSGHDVLAGMYYATWKLVCDFMDQQSNWFTQEMGTAIQSQSMMPRGSLSLLLIHGPDELLF